jgi:hypothetical protein
MVGLEGIEPPTNGLGNRCSILLSYRPTSVEIITPGRPQELDIIYLLDAVLGLFAFPAAVRDVGIMKHPGQALQDYCEFEMVSSSFLVTL